MNATWKTEVFNRFVKTMCEFGCTDDGGMAYGQYGLSMLHNGETAFAAWCYPPVNEQDENGVSTITVRGVVPGGTKQDSFHFSGIRI